MKFRIPIKKYVMDETLSWEERYKKLEAHHNEETKVLLDEIEKNQLIVASALEMKVVRGWAFTQRFDIFSDKWKIVEAIIEKMVETHPREE